MADKHYAWSEILYGAELNDDGSLLRRLSIPVGEEVSAKDLDISDEEFDELVAGGAVRNYQFPEALQDTQTSPNQLIAQGIADSEVAASTYGASPELVAAYMDEQKVLQKGTPKGSSASGTAEVK